MSKLKVFVSEVKKLLMMIKDYYNSLSPTGKVIFIIILILLKLGPDMITMPILVRHIKKKTEKKLRSSMSNEEKEKEEN